MNSSYRVWIDNNGKLASNGSGHAISAIYYNEGSDDWGTCYISLGKGKKGVNYYHHMDLVSSDVLNPPSGKVSSLTLRYRSEGTVRFTYFNPTQMLVPVPKK